jgi:PadR family transcriptional regulator
VVGATRLPTGTDSDIVYENLLSSFHISLNEMYCARIALVRVPARLRERTMLNSFDRSITVRPRNWLVPVALVTLRKKSSHGYELMERAVELGFEAINPGTVYRTLRRMEKDGLCESKWGMTSAGPPRRMYSITDAGEAYLDLWAKSLEQYQQATDAFLQAYKKSGRGPYS